MDVDAVLGVRQADGVDVRHDVDRVVQRQQRHVVVECRRVEGLVLHHTGHLDVHMRVQLVVVARVPLAGAYD